MSEGHPCSKTFLHIEVEFLKFINPTPSERATARQRHSAPNYSHAIEHAAWGYTRGGILLRQRPVAARQPTRSFAVI